MWRTIECLQLHEILAYEHFGLSLFRTKVKTGVDLTVGKKIGNAPLIHNFVSSASSCYSTRLKSYKWKDTHKGVILSLPGNADAQHLYACNDQSNISASFFSAMDKTQDGVLL